MYLVSRTETFVKLFFIVSFTGLFTYVVLAFYTFHTAYTSLAQLKRVQTRIQDLPDPGFGSVGERFNSDLIYILWWTVKNNVNKNDALIDQEGQLPFIGNNCSYINCFMTKKKNLLNDDYRNFDAIILDIKHLMKWKNLDLPQKRSIKQKYVFHSMLPSDNYVVCNSKADDYFNWTWSYKLYSDIFSPFIEVKDLKGNIVAPNINVEWPSNASALTADAEAKIRNKTKALAWVTTKCTTRNSRIIYAKHLRTILKRKGLHFDIYGCHNLKCPSEGCLKAIERDYFFYFVYEDSISEDYLTNEVLNAYNHNAVPIVFSGADLTKYLPTGSYISARYDSPEKVAIIIEYSLRNPTVYNSFHRWRNYYTFHQVEPLRGICQLCNYLNNLNMVKTMSHYETFRKWWHVGPMTENCYPKGADKLVEVLSYLNSSGRDG